MPCSLALIAHTFAEPQARRRALAVWGAVSGVGLASGPVVGGILVASVGWRAIFLANVPVGLAAAWLLMLHADETPRRRRPLDLPGQVLAMFSLAALTAGFISAGAHGWAARVTLALVISGGLASAAFVLLERTVRRPLIDPAIFRNTTFTTAVAIGFLFNFCLYGSIFCLAVGLERLRGLDALETGFALLPMTAAAAATALLAGRLVPRLGEWPVLVAGLTSGAVGATLVALNAEPANLGLLLVSTVPIGFTALAMPAMTGLAMASAPTLGLGLSAGVFNTSRQAGGALGVAVLGTVLTAGPSVSLRPVFLLWPARTDWQLRSPPWRAGVRTFRCSDGSHVDGLRASPTPVAARLSTGGATRATDRPRVDAARASSSRRVRGRTSRRRRVPRGAPAGKRRRLADRPSRRLGGRGHPLHAPDRWRLLSLRAGRRDPARTARTFSSVSRTARRSRPRSTPFERP